MEITTSYSSGRLTLHLSGELDHHGARGAMKTIEGLLDKYMPRDAVLDLSELTFMDSSGIGVVLGRYRLLRDRGGHVAIVGMNPHIARLFHMSGLDRIICQLDKHQEAQA